MKTDDTRLRFWAISRILPTLALIPFLSAAINAGPQVSLPETEFNFGQMPMSSIVQHTFWIHSTGDDTVFIDTIITGCGCTTIPLERTFLPPGDSMRFTAEFDSKGFRGSVVKRPSFRLRGDTTSYGVKFYAYVVTRPQERSPLDVSPTFFDYSNITGEKTQKVVFGLKNTGDVDISLSIVDSPQDIIAIRIPDSLKVGQQGPGMISLLPDFQYRDFTTSLTIEVNNSAMYRVTIPLFRRTESSDSTGPVNRANDSTQTTGP